MKRKKGGGGGASWMDTYGDMVTLLLCFFVLLYSMSTLDQQKWLQVVKSFNPDAVVRVEELKGGGGNEEKPVETDQETVDQEIVDEEINQLYEDLKEYIAQRQAEANISVSKGDGFVFISFNEAVFFAGESYDLSPEGAQVLDEVALMLQKATQSIDEVRVLGHTAQADPNTPNNPTVDRFLASNRATVVVVYLQNKGILDPARMISMGYGQWRPVSLNDTSTGRAKNRRVEMIVSGLDTETEDTVAKYYTDRGTPNPNAPAAAAP